MNKLKLSILYVYYNTPNELVTSLKSLNSSIAKGYSYEVIIIDNASTKPVPASVKKTKNTRIFINSRNVGYGSAMNQAAKLAKGEYLLVSNTDVIYKKDSISILLEKISKDKKIGAIAPLLKNKDGNVQQSITDAPLLPKSLFLFSPLRNIWPVSHYVKQIHRIGTDMYKEQDVQVVSGACFVIRKEVFNKVKGFDERFFLYFEEADLCLRLKKKGYRIVFYPKSSVVHLKGRSEKNKVEIKKMFQESRFKFFEKYHGKFFALGAEFFLRFINSANSYLILILAVSAFMNLYKINGLMMFFGDFGRDYLVARDMILKGSIPLVGIQSSVTWLHQGPYSIYLIALSFLVSNFNPVAPAILYGILGVLATYLVYRLGLALFNNRVGLFSALLFATSPFVVVNERMPYHTAPIPFFSALFFLVLYKVLNQKKRMLGLLFFLFGILFLFELSNSILLLIMVLTFITYHVSINKGEKIKGFFFLCLGILPFIVYDFSHKFVQTLGFPLWVVNRVRVFLIRAITFKNSSHTLLYSAKFIWFRIVSIVFPYSEIITFILLFGALYFFVRGDIKNFKNHKNKILLLFWLFIPLSAYIVQGSPGTAYFPLLFPAFSLLLGYFFYVLTKKNFSFVFIFLCIVFLNCFLIIKSDYFLSTESTKNVIPPDGYNIGTALSVQESTVDTIVRDSKYQTLWFVDKTPGSKVLTSEDNYKYLLLWRGVRLDKNADLIYSIYGLDQSHKNFEKIIYKNAYYYITRYEKIHSSI